MHTREIKHVFKSKCQMQHDINFPDVFINQHEHTTTGKSTRDFLLKPIKVK